MFSKSKYDVMESINIKNSMSLLFLLTRVNNDLKLYDNKKISKQEFDNRFKNNVINGIPKIKSICHIGYENSKDIATVSEEEIYRYMKKEGLTCEEFDYNYKMIINTYVRTILAFNIVEDENIDIYSIMTPDNLLSLIKGDFPKFRKILDSVGVNLKKENKELFDKLIEREFEISMLNNIEVEKLENIHSKYMEKNINNRVTCTRDKAKTLKYAKNLGKKEFIFDL